MASMTIIVPAAKSERFLPNKRDIGDKKLIPWQIPIALLCARADFFLTHNCDCLPSLRQLNGCSFTLFQKRFSGRRRLSPVIPIGKRVAMIYAGARHGVTSSRIIRWTIDLAVGCVIPLLEKLG